MKDHIFIAARRDKSGETRSAHHSLSFNCLHQSTQRTAAQAIERTPHAVSEFHLRSALANFGMECNLSPPRLDHPGRQPFSLFVLQQVFSTPIFTSLTLSQQNINFNIIIYVAKTKKLILKVTVIASKS
jgi:hypothetical protein